MPPTPWFMRDPSIERPFLAEDIPLVKESGKAAIAQRYGQLRKPKVLAIGPLGGAHFYGEESIDEAARRALETCGGSAGVPCLVVAVDDSFVVPIPTAMKVTGFFRAASSAVIAPSLREELVHRLGNAGGGWSAVAVGWRTHRRRAQSGGRASRHRRRYGGLHQGRSLVPRDRHRAVCRGRKVSDWQKNAPERQHSREF
jgi:hypothetical protein